MSAPLAGARPGHPGDRCADGRRGLDALPGHRGCASRRAGLPGPPGTRHPQALAGQIAEVRSSGMPFAVNVFAPNPVPADPAAYRRYADAIRPEAERYGLDLPGDDPAEDDDHWADKGRAADRRPRPAGQLHIRLRRLAGGRGPAPSRLRGRNDRDVGAGGPGRHGGGCRSAGRPGVGGWAHSGTLTPQRLPPPVPLATLLAQVRAETTVPLLATGGLGDPGDVAAAFGAGAAAAVVGNRAAPGRREWRFPGTPGRTSRTGPPHDRHAGVHRAASPRPPERVHRPLRRRGPGGLPAIHHLTSPLRRAAAAAR